MSMMLCYRCERPVDTDADPEAFYDSPDAKEPNDYALCSSCREHILEREQLRANDLP